MKASVAVKYYDGPPGHPTSFWVVGVKPGGVDESMIECRTHYNAPDAARDMAGRLRENRL